MRMLAVLGITLVVSAQLWCLGILSWQLQTQGKRLDTLAADLTTSRRDTTTGRKDGAEAADQRPSSLNFDHFERITAAAQERHPKATNPMLELRSALIQQEKNIVTLEDKMHRLFTAFAESEERASQESTRNPEGSFASSFVPVASLWHSAPMSLFTEQRARDALLAIALILHACWLLRLIRPEFHDSSCVQSSALQTPLEKENGIERTSKEVQQEGHSTSSTSFGVEFAEQHHYRKGAKLDIGTSTDDAEAEMGREAKGEEFDTQICSDVFEAEIEPRNRKRREIDKEKCSDGAEGDREQGHRTGPEAEQEDDSDFTEAEVEQDDDGTDKGKDTEGSETVPQVLRRSITASEDLETDCVQWIEALTGCERGDSSFHAWLRDGQVLCQVMNAVSPGLIPEANTSAENFKQMENISLFLKGCRALDMMEKELFTTVDLFEAKNLQPVQRCIYHLAGHAATMANYTGPLLVSSPPVRTPPSTPVRTPPASPEK